MNALSHVGIFDFVCALAPVLTGDDYSSIGPNAVSNAIG
jgi:hypothetical protein